MTDPQPPATEPTPAPKADPPPPELPVFDRRRMRRAVMLGVIRVAAAAAALLLLVRYGVLQPAAAAWSQRDQRGVVDVGWRVANLDVELVGESCCNGPTPWFGTRSELLVVERRAGLPGVATQVVLTTDVRGDVQDPGTITWVTPVRAAASRPRPTPQATRALLARLPGQLMATVIIEFAQPLDQRGFQAWGRPWGALAADAPILLTPLYVPGAATGEGVRGALPLGFPSRHLDGFTQWAAGLRPSDDRNLHRLGLPDTAELQRIARDGQIFGIIAQRVPAAQVASLLDDPAVRSVGIADVAIDLGLPMPPPQ